MPDQPNILLFVPDAMQAQAVAPEHVCHTPNFDRLAGRGVRFTNAYTPLCTCSPARASLMTGLLPHNHGVLTVEHTVDGDQSVLRDVPHFAQRLSAAGYRTGYFGKWHIERTNELERFGWQINGAYDTPLFDAFAREAAQAGAAAERENASEYDRKALGAEDVPLDPELTGYLTGPRGYRNVLHFGVTDVPPEQRRITFPAQMAQRFIAEAAASDEPWCGVASFQEPNERLIVGREAFERYSLDDMPLPESFADPLDGVPAVYRRSRGGVASLSEDHWRKARACYYARITELDAAFGQLLDQLDASGALDNTVIIVTSDHGRYVGAHGMESHNFGAYEEIYNIPLIVAGPRVAQGKTSKARIALQDIAPTLCNLAGAQPIDVTDSQSFAQGLPSPRTIDAERTTGYAEYHGTRFALTQRIFWRSDWKFVFNGFDDDELYNLADDPHEMHNLAAEPAQRPRVRDMMGSVWACAHRTGDHTIFNSQYYSMRFAAVGPDGAS